MQNDFFFVFPEFQRGGIYAVPYSGDLVIRTNVFRSLVHLCTLPSRMWASNAD